jgi:hypothetical protein
LTRTIEAGHFPALQRGNYDLRLDRPKDRCQWGELLKRAVEKDPVSSRKSFLNLSYRSSHGMGTFAIRARNGGSTSGNETVERNPALLVNHVNSSGLPVVAALAVVIPIRDRAGLRLRNSLRSLNWQSVGRPAQVVLVSHGSQVEINRDLSVICDEEHATLITVGAPSQPWNKSLALNVGIRATFPEVPYIMTMDADMILAPNFFDVLLERLRKEPPSIVLCRISDLPACARIPSNREQLLRAFDNLRIMARLRPRYGSGAIQASRRSFFFDIRGYDEDLLWWGAMDGDMVSRARLAGLEVEWIEHRTTMLHQWHPRKHNVLRRREEIAHAKRAWRCNHQIVRSRAKLLSRNPNGWGGND